jgi:hypothetical protein
VLLHQPNSPARFIVSYRARISSLCNLPRGDPADHDGSADHVGGTLLTSGAAGHLASFCARPGKERLQ